MKIHEAIADHYGPMTAKTYDGIAKKLFWGYPETLSAIAAEAVYARRSSFDAVPRIRTILDIGIGTGNVSLRLIEELRRASAYAPGPDGPAPDVIVYGLDSSSHMSQVASDKLSALPGVQIDFRLGEIREVARLFDGLKFDCIVSGFAIHHLDPSEKAALMRDLRGMLNPGGMLVIGDRMPPEEEIEAHARPGYHAVIASRWLELFEGAEKRPTLSKAMSDLDEAFAADGDKPSSAAAHLGWLRDAGFSDARSPFHSFGCGVVSGTC